MAVSLAHDSMCAGYSADDAPPGPGSPLPAAELFLRFF
jgi:hypothetical protein